MACACKAGKKSGQATAVKQVVKTNILANRPAQKKTVKKITVSRPNY